MIRISAVCLGHALHVRAKHFRRGEKGPISPSAHFANCQSSGFWLTGEKKVRGSVEGEYSGPVLIEAEEAAGL